MQKYCYPRKKLAYFEMQKYHYPRWELTHLGVQKCCYPRNRLTHFGMQKYQYPKNKPSNIRKRKYKKECNDPYEPVENLSQWAIRRNFETTIQNRKKNPVDIEKWQPLHTVRKLFRQTYRQNLEKDNKRYIQALEMKNSLIQKLKGENRKHTQALENVTAKFIDLIESKRRKFK